MKIRNLKITNFRGIRSLEWHITQSVNCLIGPGDSTKTTILDAIELALLPSWYFNVDDSDFFNTDISNPIEIAITVGDIPTSLLSDDKFGLFVRGWNQSNGIIDEPGELDELVLTISLKIDDSLEPSWMVINDRTDGKPISNRDRERLNVNRLGNYVDRHLSWSKGSPLMKLTEHYEAATQIVKSANRKVKDSTDFNNVEALINVAAKAVVAGKRFGVKPKSHYEPSFDTKSFSAGLSAVLLHDGKIPLRAQGLGTRRLLTLGLQYENSSEGGIILIDEVENGLEPYRLRHLLRQLKHGAGTRQVIITSHSSTTLQELGVEHLCVVRSHEGITTCKYISSEMQGTIRSAPEALLANKVLVCEGKTEYGIFRSLENHWATQGKEYLAYLGVILIEGGGDSAPNRALQLSKLGYDVCLFMDSDKIDELSPPVEQLQREGVKVIHWGDSVSTEERIFLDVPNSSFKSLLDIAKDNKSEESVKSAISSKLGSKIKEFEELYDSSNLRVDEQDYRIILGKVSKQNAWYKRIDYGEMLGGVISEALVSISDKDLSITLGKVEGWIYE
ncbi:ATP-dependent endonuclease [Paenibacillus sp. 32352]|uniref:ATP-dependent nuclease n=1 Tax=Paenibacillus sp. 32352 TaxID=1969111 RepID=UPI0009ADA9B5|nr:AAA family ATPase [Paenibacillus sp. 32352]